jgi:hypothetical protein
MNDTRAAGSAKAWRRGWSLGAALLLGAFVVPGCWGADAADGMVEGTPVGCESGANQGDFCTADCVTGCGNSVGTKFCRCEGGVYTQCPCLAPDDWAGAEEAPYCDEETGKTSALVGQPCTGKAGTQCVGAEPDYNTHVVMQCSCELQPGAINPNDMFELWACVPAAEVTGLPTCESMGTGIVLTPTPMKDRTCLTEWQTCIGRDFDIATETPKGCFCEKQVSDGSLKWNCGSTNKWFRPIDP